MRRAPNANETTDALRRRLRVDVPATVMLQEAQAHKNYVSYRSLGESESWRPETSLTASPVCGAMDDAPIPGSGVRATTKHGTMTVDEIAAMQPGMARLMDEVGRRYWVLYYAAKAGNWDLARYMEKETEKILKTASVARPKYREDLEAFVRDRLGPIARAIDDKDWDRFEAAYRLGITDSNRYHDKYNKRFIRFRLPDHPPEWFDLEPR